MLPLANVIVHVVDKCARRCRLHLIDGYCIPLAVKQLEVVKQPFDLEITGGECFRSEPVVFYVESDGFLCNVFLVSVKLRGKESRDAFCGCVYHISYFIFNNNK